MLIINPYPGKPFSPLPVPPAPPPDRGFYASLDQLLAADLNPAEEILPGLHRREVGEVLADEAQGKTALLLQLGLSLAAGASASPLLACASQPRRVLYVNDDAAADRLRHEIQALMSPLEEKTTVTANFQSLLETCLDGEAVSLSREAHFQRLSDWFRRLAPDLLILDGVRLLDPETDKPGERRWLARHLLTKLKQLAAEMNCAILVAHTTVSGGVRRRLGQALLPTADSLYHLRSDQRHGDGFRFWRCRRVAGSCSPPLPCNATRPAAAMR